MKTASFIAASAFLLATGACRKVYNQSVTVVKDCTGTYLRYEDKDYQVCNSGTLQGYSDGTSIKASFMQVAACNGSANNDIVCMMLHENEGWIRVQSIH